MIAAAYYEIETMDPKERAKLAQGATSKSVRARIAQIAGRSDG